jgi:hypothetical protein
VVVVVSDSLAQETSVSARIESAEERIIERGVFIDFSQWKFTILCRRWLSCQRLYRMKTVPKSNNVVTFSMLHERHFQIPTGLIFRTYNA